MKTIRYLLSIAAVLVLWACDLSAQSNFRIPISTTAVVASETVAFSGTLLLITTVAPDVSGGLTATVTCRGDLHATGQNPQVKYGVAGTDSIQIDVPGPMPARAGVPCTFELLGHSQPARLRLQP